MQHHMLYSTPIATRAFPRVSVCNFLIPGDHCYDAYRLLSILNFLYSNCINQLQIIVNKSTEKTNTIMRFEYEAIVH